MCLFGLTSTEKHAFVFIYELYLWGTWIPLIFIYSATLNLLHYNKLIWQVAVLTALRLPASFLFAVLSCALIISVFLGFFSFFGSFILVHLLYLTSRSSLCREFVFQHPKQPGSLSVRKTEVMKRGIFSSDILLILVPSLLASHLLTLGVGWDILTRPHLLSLYVLRCESRTWDWQMNTCLPDLVIPSLSDRFRTCAAICVCYI